MKSDKIQEMINMGTLKNINAKVPNIIIEKAKRLCELRGITMSELVNILIQDECMEEKIKSETFIDQNFRKKIIEGLKKDLIEGKDSMLIKAAKIVDINSFLTNSKGYKDKSYVNTIMNILYSAFFDELSLAERKAIMREIISSKEEFDKFSEIVKSGLKELPVEEIIKKASDQMRIQKY